MLCLYHVADNDGKGSAAVVKSVFADIETLGINHDMPIPYEEIEKHDKIVICDFSLPAEYMYKLNEQKDLIWIDHHVSAIKECEEYRKKHALEEIKGLRKVGTAAIVLSWQYFYPDKKIPEGVMLLGKNDIFDLSDDRVRPFEYAFQSLGVNYPQDETWTNLFEEKINIDELVKKGRAILSWIRNRNFRLVRGLVFETEFENYKCICSNMAQGYSEFFDSVSNLDDYDIMINFYMNNENTWNLSFYTKKDDIDVSQIAATFGGGGHAKAAGASKLKDLPSFLKQGCNWRKKYE